MAFYEGFNLTNNLLHEQDTDSKLLSADYWKGGGDIKELVKSVAMVGVIRGMGMIPGLKLSTEQLKSQ